MNDNKKNIINIELPLLETYVGVLRLVAASAACRAELNVDKTEDVKVIVTEIINELLLEKKEKNISIKFSIDKGELNIEFSDIVCPALADNNEENIRNCIIKHLSDELDYDIETRKIILCIKAGKGI